MTFTQLMMNRENVQFKLKSCLFKINNLMQTYFPSKGENLGSHSKNNSSPQEIILLRIDALEQKVKQFEQELIEIDEALERKLELISNLKYRWVVHQKINGISWQKIADNEDWTVVYVHKIYKDALEEIKEKEK